MTLSNAMTAGINIVEQDFNINWDYLQSVFFSTTILTTIGEVDRLEQCCSGVHCLMMVSSHFTLMLLLFVFVIYCLILGYGNIAPVTTKGRLFCIIFAIIGKKIIFTFKIGFLLQEFHSACL